MPKKIRTRIPPSPTGNLHMGTARTALFNYLFARQNGGDFILRIEDTDLERSDKKFEKDIIEGLLWLNLEWDEGPDPQNSDKYIGNFGPYRQTQRDYQPFIKKLLDEKRAFWCYHSREELEKEKQVQTKNGEPQRHICSHFKRGKPKNTKESGIIRLKSSDEVIKFNDLIRGEISFDAQLFGDLSIARNEKTPLYNLAVVVDDAQMEISHVIRGEDHISNTPKQILIYKALGFDIPKFGHMPLLLGPDKSKLSKRHGATSINEFKQQGYLPEAMINFMALLGWNPGNDREIFSIKELIKEFSLNKIHKGGAVVDIKKLDNINSYYLKQKDISEIKKLANLPKNTNDKLIDIARERATTLNEIAKLIAELTTEQDYNKDLLIWKQNSAQRVREALETAYKTLNKIEEKSFTANKIQKDLLQKADGIGDRGLLLWPLRVALSGKKQSPPPFDLAEIWGKEKSLKKIKQAIKKLDIL